MPSMREDTGKLLAIKANEEAKGRSRQSRAPAIFRETSLDTHKTMVPEYFGPSITVEKKEYPTRQSSATRRATSRQQRAAMDALTRTSQLAANGEVRSVFVPTAEQMPVCAAAGERRSNVASSEWALLDTLEVALYLGEREQQQRAARAAQQNQRTALDGQMSVLQQIKVANEAVKLAEREEVNTTTLLHQATHRQRLDSQRMAQMQLRTERENMLAEARAQREAAVVARRQEGARQAAAMAAQVEADKLAAFMRAADVKEAAARTMVENEVMQAMRRQAEVERRQADAETSRRMGDMMLAQERARDGQAEAIQAAVMARAGRAGTKALDDNRSRLDREERLIAEAAREAERREAERVAAEADKRARQKAELLETNEELKRAKAAREAAAREADRRARVTAEAQSAAEKAEAERQLQASRERTKLTKRIVASQAEETHIKAKYDDIFMTEQERRLNRQLLDQARATVVEPKQYSVVLR